MNLSRVCWQLLLAFALMSFLISGLEGRAGRLQEQHEVTLRVQVFGFTNGNESIPIEGARVRVNPAEKDPLMSEEAEAAFYKYGRTDENGVVVFNLSSSFNYFNTTRYMVRVSASIYDSASHMVDVTNTKEVSIFLKESAKRVWASDPPNPLNQLKNSLFLWFMITIVATSVSIAWILKKKHTRKHG